MMRRAPLLLLVVLLASTAVAQRDVPPLTGRVVDNADLLGDQVEESLDTQLAQFERHSGNQIVVLTIPSLEGEVLEPYANRVFRTWGLGQAEHDNGVLLLIARDDRKIRIEVGYGLEGSLTDAAAGSIIRNEMTPRFRSGDFEGGTLAAVSAILGTIEGTYTPPADGGGGSSDAPPWWFFGIFLVTHGLFPTWLAFSGLPYPPMRRYFGLLFSLAFVGSLIGIFVALLPGIPGIFGGDVSGKAATIVMLILIYILLFLLGDLYMTLSPKWQEIRKQIREASKSKKRQKVDAGWISFSAGGTSSSSGGGWSSGGGGGFSGGGGSSGGGGASGGW